MGGGSNGFAGGVRGREVVAVEGWLPSPPFHPHSRTVSLSVLSVGRPAFPWTLLSGTVSIDRGFRLPSNLKRFRGWPLVLVTSLCVADRTYPPVYLPLGLAINVERGRETIAGDMR